MLERAYDATGIAVRLNDAKIALEDALRSLPIHARNELQHAFILSCELLPVSRTRGLGVIVKPEVAYGEAEFQS